jgi:hypothetical protein
VRRALIVLLAAVAMGPSDAHAATWHHCRYANHGIAGGGTVRGVQAYRTRCKVARTVARGVRRHWAERRRPVDVIRLIGWGRLFCTHEEEFRRSGYQIVYTCHRGGKSVRLIHRP